MGVARIQRNFGWRLGAKSIALLTALLWAPSSSAKNYDYSHYDINQKDAGGYASNNYWNGSGDSKDEGVRNAYRALNRLASLDIGGAIHYGYKGYGNYINSQRMDDLDTLSWKNKGSMDSYAAAPVSGRSTVTGTPGSGDTPSQVGPEREAAHVGPEGRAASKGLSNLDRSFLYRGETGEAAAEFERRSGMNREALFNELVAAEASGLSWDDPNLMDRMESRYKAFVQKIPNQEYRANIEKMHDMFSLAKKAQVFEEGAAFYKKMRWGDGGDKVAAAAAGPESKVTGEGAAADASGEGKGDVAGAERNPASDSAPAAVTAAQAKTDDPKVASLTKDQMGMYLGLDGTKGDELKDFLGQEDSIFHVVSKRYRKLTPMLIGKML
jgi:hypothetical protein